MTLQLGDKIRVIEDGVRLQKFYPISSLEPLSIVVVPKEKTLSGEDIIVEIPKSAIYEKEE
tara:strand:+ start:41 stop:223 length:183 start_codon:yes stop_codon:yes gene_type:complete